MKRLKPNQELDKQNPLIFQRVNLNVKEGVKMKLFDRVILAIYSFCLSILSIIVILFPFEQLNFLSPNNIFPYLQNAKGNYWYSIIGLAFLLVSIRFLLSGLASKGNNYIVRYTNHGELRISTQTIEGIARSVTDNFEGIKDINTKVIIANEKIVLRIKGLVHPSIDIPETATIIQEKVREHVERCTGIEVGEVKVEINNISTPSKITH